VNRRQSTESSDLFAAIIKIAAFAPLFMNSNQTIAPVVLRPMDYAAKQAQLTTEERELRNALPNLQARIAAQIVTMVDVKNRGEFAAMQLLDEWRKLRPDEHGYEESIFERMGQAYTTVADMATLYRNSQDVVAEVQLDVSAVRLRIEQVTDERQRLSWLEMGGNVAMRRGRPPALSRARQNRHDEDVSQFAEARSKRQLEPFRGKELPFPKRGDALRGSQAAAEVELPNPLDQTMLTTPPMSPMPELSQLPDSETRPESSQGSATLPLLPADWLPHGHQPTYEATFEPYGRNQAEAAQPQYQQSVDYAEPSLPDQGSELVDSQLSLRERLRAYRCGSGV
jgi:hypothetical protein